MACPGMMRTIVTEDSCNKTFNKIPFKDPVLPASAAVNSTICPCVMPRHNVQHSGNIQCEMHMRQELLWLNDDHDTVIGAALLQVSNESNLSSR